MENLYEILQSDPGASTEQLRDSYKRLVRLYHPDKNLQTLLLSNNHETSSATENTQNADKFIIIDRAWKILSDPELRSQFDAKWHDRNLAQELPIQDEVLFEDFDYTDEEKVYLFPCRCGGYYVLSELDSQLHFDIVCCETCSLTIKVLYKSAYSEFELQKGKPVNIQKN
ncbi:unnamed protein product [Candidula unifasciata]|uniref:Diphthamide biosynthesis protein 4 n=1 Tax=Candidula unifasciata TaxID=100452 RepID=A0A8S4A432_9EUPU|nr:unnamed protein product [Candidula unifasciata]